MKDQIREFLAGILQKMNITDAVISVESPENVIHGDYTTNIAMMLSGRLKAPPMKIAAEIVERIKTDQKKSALSIFERVEIASPGFINFFLSEATLSTSLRSVLEEKERYGQRRYTSFTQGDGGKNLQKQGGSIYNKSLMDKTGKKACKSVQKQQKNPRENTANAEKTGKHQKSASFGNKKTIMVEFAHPNTHKAFHIGHLRNISTGESIVRLLESQGYCVIRANYQGDVGMHIAKALYALLTISPYKEEVHSVKGVKARVEFLGKAYAAGSRAFEENAAAKEIITDLNALVYASAKRFTSEQGKNPGTTDYTKLIKNHRYPADTIYELWKETRGWSLDYFETIYKRVSTMYDRYYFESECLEGIDRAKAAVKTGVLTESDGAVIFDGKQYGLDTRVFVNSLGLPTYEAKELALAAMEAREFGPMATIIHCVGPEQASFFKVTFKTEELLGIVPPGVQYHLAYGWVRLKKGKMSSRLGNVVLGEWLIDEAKKEIQNIVSKSRVTQKMDDSTAEIIAIGAIKYSFLKVSTPSEIAFDFVESMNMNGDSGPYLQYTYARCKSVLRKAGNLSSSGLTRGSGIVSGKTDSRLPACAGGRGNDNSMNAEERAVARRIMQFPEVVADAAGRYAPNTLCTYLFQLAQEFNLFYAKHTIVGNNQRVAFTAATAQVLKNGLYLLGINVLERM
jgi:arginyl-tRNA synthetase